MGNKKSIIIGITGATGAAYAVRLVDYLSSREDIETSLIVSDKGKMIIEHETEISPSNLDLKM